MLYLFKFIVSSIIDAFSLVLFVYCVSSWFIKDPFNKFMRALSVIVSPVLDPIRELLGRVSFLRDIPIDFSPIVAILICEFITSLL